MHAVMRLVPNEAWDGIDGGVKELTRLPEVISRPPLLLPMAEAEGQLRPIKRGEPDVCQDLGIFTQQRQRPMRGDEDQLRSWLERSCNLANAIPHAFAIR